METDNERKAPRGAVAIGGLVGAIIDPVTRRRGFATADLIAAWPEVVGSRYAECTRPEKIAWPRGDNGGQAVLVLRVEGPRAIFVQHEAGQIVERVNAFLGYGAIGRLKIVQAPLDRARTAETAAKRPLSEEEQARLGAAVATVDDEPLRAALERLGRGVLSARRGAE